MTTLDDLQRSPNALARHYRRFRVAERLLLTGHSHQAWPDVAAEGQADAFDDAADAVDGKWDRAFAVAEQVRDGFRAWLGDPGADIALGPATHDLVVRLLSALDLRSRPRLVTTTGEFHTLRRQLARLDEAGLEIVTVAADPVDTVAERLAAVVDDRTAAVFVSSVMFTTARVVPHLDAVATACGRTGAQFVVDAYHHIGPVPFAASDLGLDDAFVVGGGYKYLQLGEGNCFLRLPSHAQGMRPVITGWFAEFGDLTAAPAGGIGYAGGGDRFAGATYDPTSHYRAARVMRFFTEEGLTPELLREVYQHQIGVLADSFDELDAPTGVITRDRSVPLHAFAGFVALTSPRAAELQASLAQRGVRVDNRGDVLRFGPAPYLSDDQLRAAMATLGDCL